MVLIYNAIIQFSLLGLHLFIFKNSKTLFLQLYCWFCVGASTASKQYRFFPVNLTFFFIILHHNSFPKFEILNVRQKVRAQSLLFKNKTNIQTIKQIKHGMAKGKNSILNFENNKEKVRTTFLLFKTNKQTMVRQKVRIWFLLFKKKNPKGKEKSKISTLTLEKNHMAKSKSLMLTLKKKSHVKQKVRIQLYLKQTNKQSVWAKASSWVMKQNNFHE